MQSVWIKRGNTAIECIVIGESESVATSDGVKKTLKVRKISASPSCTFDIREDEVLNLAQALDF